MRAKTKRIKLSNKSEYEEKEKGRRRKMDAGKKEYKKIR